MRHITEGHDRFKQACSTPTLCPAVKGNALGCTSPEAGRSDVPCRRAEFSRCETSPAWKCFGTLVLVLVTEASEIKFHTILHLTLWDLLMLSIPAGFELGHPLAGLVTATQSPCKPFYIPILPNSTAHSAFYVVNLMVEPLGCS